MDGYQPINIYCASCGAPARFDIAGQVYRCASCGAETGLREPVEEKLGFRRLHQENLRKAMPGFPLISCACTGCGAEVVFAENEALTSCAFCGRSLARREYLEAESFPELVIPFRITEEEARQRLLRWCADNRGRREARDARRHIGELRGFYLPYELVKGPTDCEARRDARAYHCRGFLEGSFVNTSRQLDNLLLNGMEPYDLADIREFDFSLLAGQRVKIRDLNDEETMERVRAEIAAEYTPAVARVLETKAVTVTPDTGNLMRLSAVLPAYYLRAGNTLCAVNGQTGKVAVREAKDRYLLPWWLKPIAGTVGFSLAFMGALTLFGVERMGVLFATGCLALFLLIVLFTAYHDAYGGEGRRRLLRRIFTSDTARQAVAPPEFYEVIEGSPQTVRLRFTTVPRALKMLAIALGTIFLPVLLAALLNGLSFAGLTLSGAAVWFCITVPLAPVFLLKFGRLELYSHPLIWRVGPDGRRTRWREKRKTPLRQRLAAVKSILFSPMILAVLFVLTVLVVNVVLVLHWDQF